MVKDKKERLKELPEKQKQKGIEEEEKREYETVLEEVNELFPNIDSEEEVEILSKEDSKIIIRLKESENGTELILNHSNIPEGQTQYKKGWLEHYFTPMENYFKNLK